MENIILTGSAHKQGAAKFLSEFETWKLSNGNEFPTAQEAWDYQLKTIKEWEDKFLQATDVIKRSRKTIEDLKQFVEEQIVIIGDLEIANLELKGNL